MGRSGIRRRKRKQRLPRLPRAMADFSAPTPGAGDYRMWGPFAEVHAAGALAGAVRGGDRRRRRGAALAILVLFGPPGVAFLSAHIGRWLF